MSRIPLVLLAIALWFVERGLDLSGIESSVATLILWGGAAVSVFIAILLSTNDITRVLKRAASRQGIPKPALRVEQGKEESTGTIERGWGLSVWNDADVEVTGIHAKLEAMELANPTPGVTLSRWPTARDLHWAGQIDDNEFAIPGGQSARLNVLYYDQRTKHLKLSYHRTTEQFREENALSFDSPALILINIACDHRTPVFAVCRIDPKTAKSMVLEGLSHQPPFILLWHGAQRRKLSEFQSTRTV